MERHKPSREGCSADPTRAAIPTSIETPIGALSAVEPPAGATPPNASEAAAKASARADPWAKDGVYVRLSKRRKAKLMEIAKRLGCDGPHQAIAAHIEAEAEADDRSEPRESVPGDAFQAEVGRRFDAAANATIAMEDRFASLIERLGDALLPLAELAQGGEPEPGLLPAWLSAAQEERGSAVAKLALARARWVATRAGLPGKLAMDFEMELLNVDGQAMRPAPAGRARIDAVEPSGRFAAEVHAGQGRPVILACQPEPNGRWSVGAFLTKPDGSLGERFAELAI
jgi:hypothetical protein